MQALYHSLSEKDRRRYAAIEAEKLGHGGIEYIAKLFGCHRDTIRQGRADIEALPEDPAEGRVRKKGAAGEMLAAASPGLSKRLKKKLKRKRRARPSKTEPSGPTWD
ncbi:hypothetical protein RMSM_02047 [Rhodopirellula maiorica SM1]|uniref:Uncharacterized protein n=2 Tax=Novipirellula TaxID=2795426 RepID=M5RP07_9BACT|nr:hypothetical protein RMSM_02047 [Rhodopirellula maiorica SM1]